VMNER
jgi:hypothetical protein